MHILLSPSGTYNRSIVHLFCPRDVELELFGLSLPFLTWSCIALAIISCFWLSVSASVGRHSCWAEQCARDPTQPWCAVGWREAVSPCKPMPELVRHSFHPSMSLFRRIALCFLWCLRLLLVCLLSCPDIYLCSGFGNCILCKMQHTKDICILPRCRDAYFYFLFWICTIQIHNPQSNPIQSNPREFFLSRACCCCLVVGCWFL